MTFPLQNAFKFFRPVMVTWQHQCELDKPSLWHIIGNSLSFFVLFSMQVLLPRTFSHLIIFNEANFAPCVLFFSLCSPLLLTKLLFLRSSNLQQWWQATFPSHTQPAACWRLFSADWKGVSDAVDLCYFHIFFRPLFQFMSTQRFIFFCCICVLFLVSDWHLRAFVRR